VTERRGRRNDIGASFFFYEFLRISFMLLIIPTWLYADTVQIVLAVTLETYTLEVLGSAILRFLAVFLSPARQIPGGTLIRPRPLLL
jgi:hypothetical protein